MCKIDKKIEQIDIAELLGDSFNNPCVNCSYQSSCSIEYKKKYCEKCFNSQCSAERIA